jgi:hypothetical protein
VVRNICYHPFDTERCSTRKGIGIGLSVLSLFVALSQNQEGRWAEKDDADARYMLDAERQWAETACSHNGIVTRILAEDFRGTAPDGKRYTKADAIRDDAIDKNRRDCRLDDAKVRLFGNNVAVVYGSERVVQKVKDGPQETRCLTWTDTWLKRNGAWQIVAAQDTRVECK